jgi:hypothetical protein
VDFNHGSALNIGVISSFICGQLSSKCKASAATIAACTCAETAASKFQLGFLHLHMILTSLLDAATGQAAADAFNSALGV